MPYCPRCRSEYVEGETSCKECGVRLVESLPEESVDVEADIVEVWRARNELDAQMIKALLEGSRIRCVLSGESLRLTHGITVDGLAEVRVLVRADEAKRAREIIEHYRHDEGK